MECSFRPLAPCSCNSSSSKSIPPSEASRCEIGRGAEECPEEEVTSPALLHHQIEGADPSATSSIQPEPDPAVAIPPLHPSYSGKTAIRKNKRLQRASSSPSLRHRRAPVAVRPRVSPGLRARYGEKDLLDVALPLGMSIAAVIAEVLDRNDVAAGRISADHLSMICISAVRESIKSVSGDRFDTFMRNFEKSFISTLKTLRLLKSLDGQQDSLCTSYAEDDISEQPPVACNGVPSAVEIHEDMQSTSMNHQLILHQRMNQNLAGVSTSNFGSGVPSAVEIHEDMQSTSMNHQLILHQRINQDLAGVSTSNFGSGCSQSVSSIFEKSIAEQARANDLKEFEIALVLKKLQLKESQLSLSSDANSLERTKISMGISKASFKEEKLKNQLKDAKHEELLKKCLDCLVAGLLIMSACLFYGAYIYSYKRIVEATDTCTSPPKASKSWWLPSPVGSVSSGLHTLKCHVLVASRMLFGILMILALAYLLLQRSASSSRMPVTFILLLLGIACGFAGKMCVDTLGGSGYVWLLYWLAFCLLHFFANVFTGVLFFVLHGPVSVSQGANWVRFPYWIRQVGFYSIALLFLPVLCGLMPFASLHDWKEHFLPADKLF